MRKLLLSAFAAAAFTAGAYGQGIQPAPIKPAPAPSPAPAPMTAPQQGPGTSNSAAPPGTVVPQPLAKPVTPAPAPMTAAPMTAAPVAGDCGGSGTGYGYGGYGYAPAAKHKGLFGTAMPNGCSCYAAERNFFWGGCKDFFTPNRTCDGSPTLINGCGGHCGGLFGHQKCAAPPYATPYGRPGNNCAGPFTYLER